MTTINVPPQADGSSPTRPGRWVDDEATHFQPIHLRSAFLLALAAAALLAVEVWVFVEIDDSLLRASLTGATVISMLSAGLAGNTFRLRDIRQRTGARIRAGDISKRDGVQRQTPLATIRNRFTMAACGALVGASVLGLTVLFALQQHDVGKPTGVAALAVLACSIAGYLCGTFLRPID